jgi:hypothetical protein
MEGTMRMRNPATPDARRHGLVVGTILLAALAGACEDTPTDPGEISEVFEPESRMGPVFRPGFLIGASHQHMSGVNSGYLFTVDRLTGDGTQLGPPLPGSGLALAFNPLTGRLYASLNDEDASWLAAVNPVTGEVDSIGPMIDPDGRTHQVKGMDFIVRTAGLQVAHGTPFATQRLFGVTSEGLLVRILLTTGEARVVGDLGLDICDSTCFGATTARDGTFYLLASCPLRQRLRLFTVDVEQAVATQIAEWSMPVHSVGLSIGPRGELLAVLDESLHVVDPVALTLSKVGDTGFWASAALAYVDQLARQCPCNAPGVNHGAYVRCVTRAAHEFRQQRLIRGAEEGALIAEAARSLCGHKPASMPTGG